MFDSEAGSCGFLNFQFTCRFARMRVVWVLIYVVKGWMDGRLDESIKVLWFGYGFVIVGWLGLLGEVGCLGRVLALPESST